MIATIIALAAKHAVDTTSTMVQTPVAKKDITRSRFTEIYLLPKPSTRGFNLTNKKEGAFIMDEEKPSKQTIINELIDWVKIKAMIKASPFSFTIIGRDAYIEQFNAFSVEITRQWVKHHSEDYPELVTLTQKDELALKLAEDFRVDEFTFIHPKIFDTFING